MPENNLQFQLSRDDIFSFCSCFILFFFVSFMMRMNTGAIYVGDQSRSYRSDQAENWIYELKGMKWTDLNRTEQDRAT